MQMNMNEPEMQNEVTFLRQLLEQSEFNHLAPINSPKFYLGVSQELSELGYFNILFVDLDTNAGYHLVVNKNYRSASSRPTTDDGFATREFHNQVVDKMRDRFNSAFQSNQL